MATLKAQFRVKISLSWHVASKAIFHTLLAPAGIEGSQIDLEALVVFVGGAEPEGVG